jgi:2,3-bisphosphoglycerate-independent phosphoglycerate mutase
MSKRVKPAVLLILDGWGMSDDPNYNAIKNANTPVWDRLWSEYPTTGITTSGAAVGLPGGQMGNSEVGHLNLGSGRVVYQDFTRVSRSIRTGSFFTNLTLVNAVEKAVAKDKAVHILGLLSPGGVHSHEDHIHAAVKLAVEKGVKNVYVHAFLDGRDMPPKAATSSLLKLQTAFNEIGGGRLATMIGRYFAMDRDNRWDRIEIAYDLITQGIAQHEFDDPVEALNAGYERKETDEFLAATRLGDAVTLNDGDVVINMNYRSDRARQITRPFIEKDFQPFQRKATPKIACYVSLTEYNKDFDIPVAYPGEKLANTFGEYISDLGMRQLRIAETEKYAHVTFFFNGGVEVPYEGEDRILVPSPNVPTYDMQPEMSAYEVTDNLVAAIESGVYDAVVCNYANGDMVGHTGNYEAAMKAVEVLDECIGRVIAAVEKVGGEALITADHGNAELMIDDAAKQPHTQHTTNLVPLIYVGKQFPELKSNGALCDIAPTILEIMGLEKPIEMTGHALVTHQLSLESI